MKRQPGPECRWSFAPAAALFFVFLPLRVEALMFAVELDSGMEGGRTSFAVAPQDFFVLDISAGGITTAVNGDDFDLDFDPNVRSAVAVAQQLAHQRETPEES